MLSGIYSGVSIQAVPARGRGCIAQRDINAGETVLLDLPILLVCNNTEQYCYNCLRDLTLLGQSGLYCSDCRIAVFCSDACLRAAQANPAAHTADVCRVLSKADFSGLEEEDTLSLKLLTQAQALSIASKAQHMDNTMQDVARQQWTAFAGMQSAVPSGMPLHNQQRRIRLHKRLRDASAAAGVNCMCLQDVEGVLSRESINGYGVMAKSGPGGERRIRGTGIYPFACYVNHECLPNVARVDDFDSRSQYPHNTMMCFRALHDLPAGEEITQSYFPLHIAYQERQKRLQEDYGFTCTCPRCKEEGSWLSEDEEAMEGDAPETEEDNQEMDTDAGVADEAYISMFLLKYVCPVEECGGTMIPPPTGDLIPADGTTSFRCNMCGLHRTEEQFMAAVQEQ